MKSSSQVKTVQWLLDKSKRNYLDLSVAIQRNEVWNAEHKSNLIASILRGFPIESLLFEEIPNSKNYKVLDGKQRTLTLIQFINNEFKLHKNIKVKDIDGLELVGLTFDKLESELQQTILNYNLTFTIVRDLDGAEERELLFFLRNQAIPLSNLELTRVRMGSSVLDNLKPLLTHPFLTETIKLSRIAKNNYVDQQLLIQFLISEMQTESGFSGKEIMKFAEETLRVTSITEEIEEKVRNVMTYLHDAIGEDSDKEIAKLIKKRIHIPMIYRAACDAFDQNVKPEAFRAWMLQFFKDISNDPENDYSKATRAGSAQKRNVDVRTAFIKEHLENYLTK
ncbi:conserved hypothetical protein [Candidatus Desulfosporosinus infrequens]|uniref:GmrSD restriction endonucleases N-terminal domain-containing protein n=1 Tax=Candidatus Desulfosporosinus infrequens TaxID=2043169 RepID=A0A2U3L557_9FIRM|nr:conserved hypothetical protein [Candidatus Desulfosporosinus infrequens]